MGELSKISSREEIEAHLRLVDAKEEQVALLEAWPQVPKGALTQLVAITVRKSNREFGIQIREAFDHRLPARVLFIMGKKRGMGSIVFGTPFAVRRWIAHRIVVTVGLDYR